jgi:hypothetical protein
MARPASNLHLQPKNGGWRARVMVPVELQGILGKKLFHTRVWKVTKSEAAALAWPEVQKFEALIENARSGKMLLRDRGRGTGTAATSRAIISASWGTQ